MQAVPINKHIPFVPSSIALGIVASMVSVPQQAGAQALEEIIVTARRRVQDVQDIPMAITAFDEKALREGMVRGFEDYVRDLTSVTFGTSGPGASTIAFRGAVSQPSGFDTISSSTLYLDEIPITRDGQNPDVRLYDVERLEALSGPQPTLYGAGSQSGTLKIVTNKPNTEETDGWVMAEAGTIMSEGDPSYNVSGALNLVAIPDTLAIRLVGFYEEEGGYIDNVLGTTSVFSPENGDRDNADKVEDDINDWVAKGARVFVRWTPNENWIIDAGVAYQSSELGAGFDYNPAFGDLNTVKFKDEKRDDEWYNLSLTIQGDLGFADLTIAGGTHNRKIDYDLDSTAYMTAYKVNGLDLAEYYTGIREFLDYDTCAVTYGCYLFVNYNDFGADPTAQISLDQEVTSFAQEIRLVSKDTGDNKFNWLVGAFYEDTDNEWDYLSFVDDLAANGGGGSIFTYYGVEPTNDWFDQGFRADKTYNGLAGNSLNGQLQNVETIAVFAEGSYRLTEDITLTAGGRWFETDRSVAENSLFVGNVFDNFDVVETTEDFSPRLNVTWTPTDDSLIYATYSEGVRVGGQNGGVTQNPASIQLGAPQFFGPDKLKNHEIGAKATWMDGRLLTNLTAFVMDWEDYQIQVDLPVAGSTTVNAGNASIDGAEGNIAFAFAEGWELSAAATYLDARIDDDIILNNGVIVAGEKGDPLPVVPEWKVAASLQYGTELPWSGLTGVARFDYNYVDESVNGTNASVSLFGASTSSPQVQPSYDVGSLYFSVESVNGWSAWIGVDNLWDERAITFISPRFSDDRVFTLRPREISVGWRMDF
ncbi:TonB-dependent receptor [Halioglobus pacificus]|uniref:TonB-dependent receptor n=1 Tax=Parahalioglobus pacificus TaxID=930806 RepID=A0A918XLS1_9GAMM|nr:TonB-dependent receptor [Halioglobus pacificus]